MRPPRETELSGWVPHLLTLARSGTAPLPGAPADRLTAGENQRLARAVRELSKGLTGDRSLAGASYLDDERLLFAYLAYYWPLSFSQTEVALDYYKKDVRPFLGRVLDIGCGPGPAAMAAFSKGAAEVTAVDRSAKALEIAVTLAKRRGRKLVGSIWDAETASSPPAGEFDLILLVHVLNELRPSHPEGPRRRARLIEMILASLAPEGRLLIVEPASASPARDAILLRDLLVAGGLVVESPCTVQEGCPAIPDGTCHQDRSWKAPTYLVRLAHAARTGRESLKFVYFVFSRREAAPRGSESSGESGPAYRVVSDRFMSKSGRLRLIICGPEGRVPLSVDKDASFPCATAFRRARRGDLLRFAGVERRTTGFGLVRESRLELTEY